MSIKDIFKPSTSNERKNLFLETFVNNTNKATKISPNSSVNAIASGVAKVSGKSEKDIALAIGMIYPDLAYGEQLDLIAQTNGVSPRFQAIGSTVYIRLHGTPGITYQPGTIISGYENIEFKIQTAVTIPDGGFIYTKVSSVDIGSKTNVSSLSLTRVNPEPNGHQYVVNETAAYGGRDYEDDTSFRERIKRNPDYLANNTLSMIQQKAVQLNNTILKINYFGINKNGKLRLGIVTINGENLSQSQLTSLENNLRNHLSIYDIAPIGTNYSGIEFTNVVQQPIDISFRAELDPNYSYETIRNNIVLAINRYLDPRTWDSSKDKVEWDTLFEIVKKVPGVTYVPDQWFYPKIDIDVYLYKLPRFRGLIISDLQGNLYIDNNNALSPLYYSNSLTFNEIDISLRNGI